MSMFSSRNLLHTEAPSLLCKELCSKGSEAEKSTTQKVTLQSCKRLQQPPRGVGICTAGKMKGNSKHAAKLGFSECKPPGGCAPECA